MDEDELSDLKRNMRERLRIAIGSYKTENGERLSLTEIAREIGISYRYLIDILNKDTNITFDVIVKLTEFFDVSFEWLIGREDYKKTEYQYVEEYGLSDSVLNKLSLVYRGTLPYKPKAEKYDPLILSYDETNNLFVDTAETYFSGEDNKRERKKINCRYLRETINWALDDREFIQLIDSYLHSEWASIYIPEDTSIENMDVFIITQIQKVLDERRYARMPRYSTDSKKIKKHSKRTKVRSYGEY